MAITITLDPLSPVEIRAKNVRVLQGKITLSGTYLAGGFSVAGIASNLRWLKGLGGKYVWQYVPTTNKVKAMKFVDVVDAGTADGTLVEESDAVTLTDVIYYQGYVAEI